MPVYIEKINGDVDQPTDRPTDQQGEYRAICLFECQKIEKRQRFAIAQLCMECEEPVNWIPVTDSPSDWNMIATISHSTEYCTEKVIAK